MGKEEMNDIELISSEIVLPNGVKVPNRLVKAAMVEGIAHPGGLPGPGHRRLYRRWAQGGWGIIISGNVQVDPRHLATPHDRYYPSSTPRTIAAYAELRQAMLVSSPSSSASSSGTTSPTMGTDALSDRKGKSPERQPLVLVQLSHPGLQSSSTISFSRNPFSQAVAPCSTRPELAGWIGWLISRFMWPRKSRILNAEEWLEIVRLFVVAAQGLEEAGWDGVQLHSAHGYLLAEWLSPLTNPDPIRLHGTPKDLDPKLHLLWLIVNGIRKVTGPKFTVSVKVNCSDFVRGGLTEQDAEVMIKEMVSWRTIDILEISGGTYTNPTFATPETLSASGTRQSLFAHFTTSLLPHLPSPPDGPAIILTGGMHDRSIIASSLRDRACDLVGLGRPACINPRLPDEIILNPDIKDSETNLGGYTIRGTGVVKWLFGGGDASTGRVETRKGSRNIPLVGAGMSTLWHEWQLGRLGRGVNADLGMHWIWGGVMLELIWWGMLGGGPLASFGWTHG